MSSKNSSSNSLNNVNVGLTDEELENLDKLVEFFQAQTISKVTRTDVIRYVINKNREILDRWDTDPEFAEQIQGFWLAMGIDINYKVY
jgi:hypothetical protein